MDEKCTKTLGVRSSGTIMPNPLSALNHFTVPSATAVPFSTPQHLREIPGTRQRQTTCVIRSRPMPSILAAEPPAAMIPGRISATTPALPSWKAGVVPRLFAPRDGWIGTLDTAQDAAIFTTGPGTPGRLSSVRFEVQPHSDDTKSPDDPASGRRSAQVRLTRYLTSFGRTTLCYDYGPLVSTGIGPEAKSSCVFGPPEITTRIRTVPLGERDTPTSKPSPVAWGIGTASTGSQHRPEMHRI